MTASFDLDNLRTILRSCAGEPESTDLSADIAATAFADLGYDSIALMETAACVERDFGIPMDDEAVVELATPQDFVDFVAARLGQRVVTAPGK